MKSRNIFIVENSRNFLGGNSIRSFHSFVCCPLIDSSFDIPFIHHAGRQNIHKDNSAVRQCSLSRSYFWLLKAHNSTKGFWDRHTRIPFLLRGSPRYVFSILGTFHLSGLDTSRTIAKISPRQIYVHPDPRHCSSRPQKEAHIHKQNGHITTSPPTPGKGCHRI